MTPKQLRSLAKYTSVIAAELGLRDWTLAFPDEPCEEGALAEVDCTYGRKRATVRFAPDFMHHPPEEQRIVVLHELIHIHFAQERQAVRDALDSLGRDAREVAHESYRMSHEYGVDGLASAIADRYPLWEGA